LLDAAQTILPFQCEISGYPLAHSSSKRSKMNSEDLLRKTKDIPITYSQSGNWNALYYQELAWQQAL